ncbi:protein ILRUN [Condylostylus longicornis]|uniref:protein ILRUN n=1 Tax=Condylostylus longicornis TaxID=2530218 RepID=UPI00244DCC8C|nr:protein ILRUN [Condylostylus longicornis]XP_055371321.1 protein ILRUN [Condylostylus longicornis]
MDLDPQDLPSTQQTQQQPNIFNGFGSTDSSMFQQNYQHQQPQQQQQIFPVSGSFGTINQAIPMPAPPGMQADTVISQQTMEIQSNNQLSTQPSNEIRPPVDVEIDSLLLQQFSCLGTTDHEDLINQLQSLMNNQCNKDTARFFLEMSNWNLQTAVCCYLDYYQMSVLPSMKILETSRPSELTQVWKLQNNGNEQWPTGCYLMSQSQTKRIEVPAIRSGETCNIHADIPLSSPPIKWRLCTPNGCCFGETIWMVPSDSEDETSDLANRMSQLRTTQQDTTTATSTENFPQVNVVISVKMD